MRKLCLIGSSVLLLASLALGQKDEDVIRKLDAEWSAAPQNKDVEKSVSVYADDGSMLPNHGSIATGRRRSGRFGRTCFLCRESK